MLSLGCDEHHDIINVERQSVFQPLNHSSGIEEVTLSSHL